jgi:multidrug efflux pump subunit AcrA (membrane-fusion protein)
MSISPNVPSPQESYQYESAGTPRWIGVLFGIVIALLAILGFAGYSTQSRLSQDLAKQQEQNKILTAQLDQANARLAEMKGHLEVTEQKVGMTQAEISQAKSRAESIRKEQQTADQKLTAQLTQAQKENEEKIGAVASEVGGAKKDIEATKSDLEAAKSKMASAMGDMNVMSGLIARNRDDLEELKRRGDRNYYEFTIQKSKAPQRVGPVQVTLNKTDPRKSKYTITVIVDDKTIEKKDKTSGEPVQFYVAHARGTPYEFVVFDVGKNQITGYLSTPKDTGTAAPAAAAPAAQAATPTKP